MNIPSAPGCRCSFLGKSSWEVWYFLFPSTPNWRAKTLHQEQQAENTMTLTVFTPACLQCRVLMLREASQKDNRLSYLSDRCLVDRSVVLLLLNWDTFHAENSVAEIWCRGEINKKNRDLWHSTYNSWLYFEQNGEKFKPKYSVEQNGEYGNM